MSMSDVMLAFCLFEGVVVVVSEKVCARCEQGSVLSIFVCICMWRLTRFCRFVLVIAVS